MSIIGDRPRFTRFQVRRDPELCIDCKRCEAVCPGSIKITARQTIRDCECIGCLECLPVCPQKECLTLSLPGKTAVPPLLLPILIIGCFLLFWLVARLSGHWQSQIPPEAFHHYYQEIQSIGHP